jgi:hypothetical protein
MNLKMIITFSHGFIMVSFIFKMFLYYFIIIFYIIIIMLCKNNNIRKVNK